MMKNQKDIAKAQGAAYHELSMVPDTDIDVFCLNKFQVWLNKNMTYMHYCKDSRFNLPAQSALKNEHLHGKNAERVNFMGSRFASPVPVGSRNGDWIDRGHLSQFDQQRAKHTLDLTIGDPYYHLNAQKKLEFAQEME